MAFSVKVTGIHLDHPTLDKNPGQQYPVWEASLPWWDARELRDDPRFREVYRNAGYQDFVAVMTLEEFEELHQHYLPKYQWAEEQPGHWWQKEMREMTYQLSRRYEANKGPWTNWCIVLVYEWESGM
jgi:hypothetical protein